MRINVIQLYHRRFKAVQTEEERSAWLELSECYMTEESDDEAEGVVRRHQLPWASDSKLLYIYNYLWLRM